MKFLNFIRNFRESKRHRNKSKYSLSYCKDLSYSSPNWYVKINEYMTYERVTGRTFNSLPADIRKDLFMCGIPRDML